MNCPDDARTSSAIRRISQQCWAVALLILLTSSVSAQMGGGGRRDRPAPIFPDIDKETLILTTPEKWYPYTRRTDDMVDTYIFPTGQEPTDWKEALRQEVFLTTAGVTAPRQVYELRSESTAKTCDRYDTEILAERQENGYAMYYWRQECGMGEDVIASLHKVILGEDQLYIVSKVWKSEPRERDWTRWEEYLEGVYVCDPVREGHRCRPIRPAGGPAGMGAGRR